MPIGLLSNTIGVSMERKEQKEASIGCQEPVQEWVALGRLFLQFFGIREV
jgi:hypothetical protein